MSRKNCSLEVRHEIDRLLKELEWIASLWKAGVRSPGRLQAATERLWSLSEKARPMLLELKKKPGIGEMLVSVLLTAGLLPQRPEKVLTRDVIEWLISLLAEESELLVCITGMVLQAILQINEDKQGDDMGLELVRRRLQELCTKES